MRLKARSSSPKLSAAEGKKSLQNHVLHKAARLREKYNLPITYEKLRAILCDREHVRYPVSIEFDSRLIPQGFFAFLKCLSDNPRDGYVIYLHEYFKKKPEAIPDLILYHLAAVNYGDFATSEEAELFGAGVLGLDRDSYYRRICRLVDQIPSPRQPMT